MPRKTLFLIIVLAVITCILFYFALAQPTEKRITVIPTPTMTPNPALFPQTILAMTTQLSSNSANTNKTVAITIDTGANTVTGTQLELAYDPTSITNVIVTPGTFITKPVVLLNNVDQKEGRISYAVAIEPNGKGTKGTGTIATISFTIPSVATKPASFTFLNKTQVTAENVQISVLKQASNFTYPVTSN